MFGEETLEQIWRTFTNREAADPVSMFVDLVNSQSWVGQLIAGDLATNGVEIDRDSELVAMIAYLQRLGRGPQPTGTLEEVN